MNNEIPEYKELPDDVKLPEVNMEEVCPLLSEIVNYLRKWSPESYEGYHIACALAALSILSARRVQYFDGGLRSTNLNIILVGHTGLTAKTTVLKLIKGLFRSLDLGYLLLPDTITAQKLLSVMCIKLPDGFDKMDDSEKNAIIQKIQKNEAFAGQKGWIFDEFGMFLREMSQSQHYNATFNELLKKFDDNSITQSNSTQRRGDEVVYYPFLTLIGAMTPSDLSHYAQKGADIWGDGFNARLVFICPPDDFRKDEPFPDEEKGWPEEILSELKSLHKDLGVPIIKFSDKIEVFPAPGIKIKISQKVKDAVFKYRIAMKDFIQGMDDKDLAGNYIRFPEIALRIAVLTAAFNHKDIVNMDNWCFAQNLTEEWRRNLHRLYYQTLHNGSSANSISKQDPIERIYDQILDKGPVTSRKIQQDTPYKAGTVNPLLESLVSLGKIKRIPFGRSEKFDVNNVND